MGLIAQSKQPSAEQVSRRLAGGERRNAVALATTAETRWIARMRRGADFDRRSADHCAAGSVIELGSRPPTLVDLVQRHAARIGPEICFRYLVDGETDEQAFSYAQLDERARAIAAWLQQHKMAGQRALLLFPPGLDFIAGFFGCLYAGVVAVPAYPPRMNRKMDRIDSIATDCEAAVALTTQAVLERVQPLLELTPDLKKLAWLAVDQVAQLPGRALGSTNGLGRDAGVPAIYLGLDGHAQGRDAQSLELLQNCAVITHAFELTRSSTGMFWLPS